METFSKDAILKAREDTAHPESALASMVGELPDREYYTQSYLFISSSDFPVGHKLYIL